LADLDLIKVKSKLKRFSTSSSCMHEVKKVVHLKMLELIYLIRSFERTLLDLKEKGLVYGPVHSSVGQEAVAAGCSMALRIEDLIGSTHRAHHHFLGKALAFYTPPNYDPVISDFTSDMQNCVERTMYEIMGLKYGWCGGRGGSMHLRNFQAGIVGTNAIVGGGIPLTTGVAWAQKLKNTSRVVVNFLGDGAVNQGVLLEASNMAAVFKLPVIYLVENNLYAVGTKACEASSVEFLAQRALGMGIDGIVVDGMDPVSVYILLKSLTEEQRRGEGPVFVEALTYRFFHHAGKNPGSTLGYRTEQEEKEWLNKDPCVLYPEKLKEIGVLKEEEDNFIKEKVKAVIKKAVSKVVAERDGSYFIPSEHWPSGDTIYKGVPDGKDNFEGIRFSEREYFKEFSRFTFVNVISKVIAKNMEKDDSVIVLGEEVANLGGGAYNATRFPLKQFPERVINTPISEAGFTGMAFGLSMCGLKPVVEIMFPDFALVAADQLFNQIARLRYLYGGEMKIHLVVRTRIATGLGYGAQHSSDLVGLFAMFRGWRIVAPSNPFDYVGLFNTAILCPDPVLILEHHSFYKMKGDVPEENLDYYIPFGKARIFKNGQDITVVTYLRGVTIIENLYGEFLERGISIEGIDLRTIDYHNIDYNCIVESVKKTGHLVILEESPKSLGIGARISDEVQLHAFKYLKKPVYHIGSIDVPIPVSKKLEQKIVIDEETVKDEIERFLKW